jgi:hypothetical protein
MRLYTIPTMLFWSALWFWHTVKMGAWQDPKRLRNWSLLYIIVMTLLGVINAPSE